MNTDMFKRLMHTGAGSWLAFLALEIESLHFAWRTGMDPVLTIERPQVPCGERVFIEGPSGSGKSTLLSLVAGVVIPQKGRIRVHGQLLNTMHDAARDRFRADQSGYIYQSWSLSAMIHPWPACLAAGSG